MKTRIIGLVIALALIVAVWAFLPGIGVSHNTVATGQGSSANSSTGKQTIEITAKNGYSPTVIKAKAGMPILLKVRTQDTQDCSTGFTIPTFGINTTLPATGETTFEFPAQKAGETIEGSCQMGMSHFTIEFD